MCAHTSGASGGISCTASVGLAQACPNQRLGNVGMRVVEMF